MKRKILYRYILLCVAIGFFTSCKEKVLDPDASFEYYVIGKEEIKNPEYVYVGDYIYFRTSGLNEGEKFVVWTGEPGSDYDKYNNTDNSGDTALSTSFNTGKVMLADAINECYGFQHGYKVSSKGGSFKVYVIASADGNKAATILTAEAMKEIKVLDTSSVFKSFTLRYREPTSSTKYKDVVAKSYTSNDTIYVRIPFSLYAEKLVSEFDAGYNSVSVNGVEQISFLKDEVNATKNDYTQFVKFDVKSDDGKVKTFNVVRAFGTSSVKKIESVDNSTKP
ncbi:MAG: hypothetical protein IPO21_14105 [Bacteroidales bacterium]|nr:hypothetical protein [Bacteroidales bacterium]